MDRKRSGARALSAAHGPSAATGLLACLAVGVGALAAAGAARAADSIWDHNGSEMLWSASGSQRVISYLTPRSGLPVAPGTVLFDGRRVGEMMEGTARIFREGCPPAEYYVSGPVVSETEVVLSGAAPIRAQSGCAITGYSRTSSNATLRFTYLRSASEPDDAWGQDEVGHDSFAVPLPDGSEITVNVDYGTGSHIMPDFVDAVLSCPANASHVLVAPRDLNVCSLDDVSADVIHHVLVIDATQYNHDTAACEPVRFEVSYAGLCR